MSRIRSIHPGIWTDDEFMALTAHARLLLIGLWTEAFDDGVFEWKPRTVKARIFPADNVEVEALLEELIEGGFIRKEEFDGKPIGLVRNFRAYQRPKKPNSSQMFRPEWGTYVGLTPDSGGEVPNQSPSDTEKSPQMEDGGGKREEVNPPLAPQGAGARSRDDILFQEIWDAFPRSPNSNVRAARGQFNTLTPDQRKRLLKAAHRYHDWWIEDCRKRGETQAARLSYVPHLANWIKTGAWENADDLPVYGAKLAEVKGIIYVDRFQDEDLFKACEQVLGKKTPTGIQRYAFPSEIVEKAKAAA